MLGFPLVSWSVEIIKFSTSAFKQRMRFLSTHLIGFTQGGVFLDHKAFAHNGELCI